MAQATSLAKELNDSYGLAQALFSTGLLAHIARHPDKVEQLASDLTELSTRQNFAFWLAGGEVLRGWARSACGDVAEGVAWIEHGIADWLGTGATMLVPYYLALKAEGLHLAGRNSEALEAISEAEALAERSEERWWCAELHRLRGVFLATLGADEIQIEASFLRSRQSRNGAEVGFATKACRCKVWRISPPKGVPGRRAWLPITSLVAACNAVPFAEPFP